MGLRIGCSCHQHLQGREDFKIKNSIYKIDRIFRISLLKKRKYWHIKIFSIIHDDFRICNSYIFKTEKEAKEVFHDIYETLDAKYDYKLLITENDDRCINIRRIPDSFSGEKFCYDYQ